jgi:hypothetical protein
VAALRSALSPFEVEQAQARLAAFQPNAADPIANGVFAPPPAEESAEPAPVPAAQSDG